MRTLSVHLLMVNWNPVLGSTVKTIVSKEIYRLLAVKGMQSLLR